MTNTLNRWRAQRRLVISHQSLEHAHLHSPGTYGTGMKVVVQQ